MGFGLQAFGPFLQWLTLGVLAATPVLAGVVLYKLGSLPGSIARTRGHPQQEAIGVCGWMGIVTVVLWPVAMVWAHSVPPGSTGTRSGAPNRDGSADEGAVRAELAAASRRLADLENRLREPAGERR